MCCLKNVIEGRSDCKYKIDCVLNETILHYLYKPGLTCGVGSSPSVGLQLWISFFLGLSNNFIIGAFVYWTIIKNNRCYLTNMKRNSD